MMYHRNNYSQRYNKPKEINELKIQFTHILIKFHLPWYHTIFGCWWRYKKLSIACDISSQLMFAGCSGYSNRTLSTCSDFTVHNIEQIILFFFVLCTENLFLVPVSLKEFTSTPSQPEHKKCFAMRTVPRMFIRNSK